MSLINEALKKAQRQRTEGTEAPPPAPTDAGTVAPRVARREKPAGFRSQMLMAVGGGAAVVILVLAIGGVWYWRSGQKSPPPKEEVAAVHPPTTSPAATAPAATTPVVTAPAPTSTAPATVVTAPAKPAPSPEATLAPAQVIEAPKPAPVISTPLNPASGQFTLPLTPAPGQNTVAAASTPPPTVSLPVVSEAAKVPDRPKPPPHMVTIIENLRVAGIRAAGDDSKVLMNDRVYRLNDIVDHELGLKLTGVTAKSLTFEDDHGAVYTRHF